ncbi:jeltraxin-like [Rhinoderma darwinii]|uniref:jeltraxin-like n=1 Tax=Rhinoderma darwinii TaxID=43563 RepID=UPI003F66CDAE
MNTFSILFVLLFGCFPLEAKNIIVFPKQTATDHVILQPTVKQPLKQLTICLRSYSELRREQSLLSLATPGSGSANTFYVFSRESSYVVSVNEEELSFRVDPQVLDWKCTCVTWDSGTGLVELWINGKRYPRKIASNRSPIGPQMSVILGQDQDSYAGAFDASQSFVGEICDVSMWDYVLPPSTMKMFTYAYIYIPGNIFNWINGTHVVIGGAIILDDN